jgi:hypothetical protein
MRRIKSDAVDVVSIALKGDLPVPHVVLSASPEPAASGFVQTTFNGANFGAIERDVADALKGFTALAAGRGLCGHARSVANQNGRVNVH